MVTVRRTFTIDEDVNKELPRIAKEQGLSVSAFISWLIANFKKRSK
jgi:predicted CopG family antitoxin